MAGTSLTRGQPQAGAELGRDPPGWPTGRRFEGRRALGAIFPATRSAEFFWRFSFRKTQSVLSCFSGGPTSRPGERRPFSSPSFGGLEFGELRYAVRESHNQFKYHKITVILENRHLRKVAEKGA
jgi:hypothetical protein